MRQSYSFTGKVTFDIEKLPHVLTWALVLCSIIFIGINETETISWSRHVIEILSALLALCEGNLRMAIGFPVTKRL